MYIFEEASNNSFEDCHILFIPLVSQEIRRSNTFCNNIFLLHKSLDKFSRYLKTGFNSKDGINVTKLTNTSV